MSMYRSRLGLLAALATMALPAATALAARTGVLAGQTMNGHPVPCVAQADGVRVCHADAGAPGDPDLRLKSFDGTPLSLYVTLPPAPASGVDGNYPLIIQSHGWGEPPSGTNDTQYGGPTAEQWARDGYAVVQLAARGWGNSCGTPQSRLVDFAACAKGYVHLDDYRYEARDAQNAAGLLVDEGVADPNRIGATGESYGAGLSLELATLKDRVMNTDGSLVPWKSPKGTPLRIAAAAPFAGWSDLAYSLRPNGRTLDTQITSPTADLALPGVEKLTILSGLYVVGTEGAYYAPPGLDPEADNSTWFLDTTAGEPYAAPVDPVAAQELAQYRSPYYLLQGDYGFAKQPPAPVFMANGFTDDVFPADEVLRYYNLAHELYPSNPFDVMFFDGGHQRGDNKPIDADAVHLSARIKAFLDHFVKGEGPRPDPGVTAFAQTCPSTVASEGPYTAPSWDKLQRGEVDFASKPSQTILSHAGDPTIGKAFDPVAGTLACATAPGDDQGTGVATYRLPAAEGDGYTLLGAPVVTADLSVTGPYAYVAARLLDVDPKANTETLVARGLYRIDPAAPNGRQTFELHANGWRFANGHIPKLELLGQDAPYSRPSNTPFSIDVSNLELTLPVHDQPGAPGTSSVVKPRS